ncbi:MAG TPA: Uma2 family endonuclease [Candidatus Baltobacteraceae bacterium]|nr:Uma2 family endonuclease [Candidatus Baltobacteraceae bacterium]
MELRISDDEKPYVEWLEGRPVPKVSPKHRHSVAQFAICAIVRRLGKGRGTWGTEWRFELDDRKRKRTSLVPDVAFVSYERWRPLGDENRQQPPFAPDIAVEVRSPSDRMKNLLWKVAAYLERGALLVLDVLPEERRIVAYDRNGIAEFATGDLFEHAAVPWLRFAVAEVFEDFEPGE